MMRNGSTFKCLAFIYEMQKERKPVREHDVEYRSPHQELIELLDLSPGLKGHFANLQLLLLA